MELNASAEEISRLQRCINDLVSLLALPTVWIGSEPCRILEILLDSLRPMLCADFICVRVIDPVSNAPVEVMRVAPSCELEPHEIREMLSDWLEGDGQKRLPPTRKRFGDKGVTILAVPLQLCAGTGMILVGSSREDIPGQTESLVLSVASKQASIGLKEAWLRSQRKRTANQHETQVAERTETLFAANEKLKRNAETLQASEGDLRSIIDMIPTLAWSAGPDGSANFVNRGWLEYTGLSAEEAQNWGWKATIHPDDVSGLEENWRSSLASGIPVEAEARMRRFDGAYRWFLHRANPLRDESKRIVKWYGTCIDIEDQKRAGEAQRARERDLRSIIDAIPALAWSAGPDGSADFLNRRWLDYTGLSEKQALGWGWGSAIHPDDVDGLVKQWQSALASGVPIEAEGRMRRFDGAYRWFLFLANPLRDESGKIVKWYGTNVDIEDRKRVEEGLRASELSWRQIVDNIPGLVATMGPMGEVEFLNRQTLEYFGKTNEELKNWSLIGAVHPDDLPLVIEARAKSIEAGRIYEVEHRCRRADGVYRWFQVRGLPVRDGEGTITSWYLLLTDIEDRKRGEEALQQTQFYLSEGQRVAHMGSWAFNAAGFDYWSPELLRVYGLDPTGKPPTVEQYLDLVHPEDRESMQQGIQNMLADHRGFDFTKRIVRPDGEIRHIRSVAVPVVEGATFQGCVGTGMDVTEQEQLLRRLRQSEQELHMIIDTIRPPIVVLAPDGTLLSSKRAALDFTGLTAEEVDGGGFLARACHPDEVDRVHDRRRLGLLEGVPFQMEVRGRFKGTEYRWLLMRYHPLKDDQGQILRWYGTATDITDLKKAEEALRSNERNLNLIINTIPTHIYVLNTEGSVQHVNQAVMDYTGLTLEDVQQEDYRDRVIHPEDFERVRAERSASLGRVAPFSTEQRVLGNDGQYRWFLVSYKPLLDDEGRIVRWYVAAFDIEDRKQAEAQVEQAYLRLAEAQRLSKTGSFITDLVADEHNWSEETFRIFEFDPSTKVTVRMIRDIIHPDDLPSFDAVIARGMTGTDVDFLFRLLTSRGAVKHIRGMARVMVQNADRPLFIGALQDITENKVAEAALDKARSELARVARVTTLNTLTASIAHEINQPLASLITNASICLRRLNADPPNVDGARETAMRTIRDGNRASDVITRLRALFSKKEFTLEMLDLNEITREVIALSLGDLQRNQVILQAELADDLPRITGDRVQLQQVILNLLRNASDAMGTLEDRPRQLLVRTRRDGDDRVGLLVQDAGCGVNPQDVEKLFEAFYTTKSGGMGIGLSVSRSIIERHQGRLWAEPNDGPGTTFSFSIPCSPAGAKDAAA